MKISKVIMKEKLKKTNNIYLVGIMMKLRSINNLHFEVFGLKHDKL